jgi:hypothetical protein
VRLALALGGVSLVGCAAIAGLDQEYVIGEPGGAGMGGGGTTSPTGTNTGSHTGGAAIGGSGSGLSQGGTGGVGGAVGTGLTDVLDTGDVLLFYGVGNDDSPRMRTWSAATSTWSTPELTVPAGAGIRWVVTPETLRWPVFVGVLSADGDTDLDLLRHDGTSWVVDWSTDTIDISNADRRGFDIEYEDASGEALVVYSDDTGVPQFRTYGSNGWSTSAPVLGMVKSQTVLWIELVARPGTDEIALVYSDADRDLSAVIWDGQSWGSEDVLETALNETTYLSFTAAYEAISGDLVVFWPRSETNPYGFIWTTKPAGGSFTAPVLAERPLLRPGPARLRSEPGSDRIALAYVEFTCGGDSCDDFIASVWDGNDWTDSARVDPEISTPYNNYPGAIPVDVAWISSTEIVSVYTESSSGLDWARWYDSGSGSGWALQTDEPTSSGLGPRTNVQALTVAGRSEALFLMSYDDGSLYSRHYGASTWSSASSVLGSGLSSQSAVPFAAAMKR